MRKQNEQRVAEGELLGGSQLRQIVRDLFL
jgi:hypothetical protein